MLTTLGIDPGTNNCAYAIITVTWNPTKFRVVTHGMIENPIKEIAGLNIGERTQRFTNEIKRLKKLHNCNFMIAERFMTRGNKGTTIEAVGIMLGILATVFGTEIAFIPAAQWKNAINKVLCLNDLYDDMKQYGIAAHRVDATCIGLYGATLTLNEPHFSMIKNLKTFKKTLIDTR